MAPVNKDLILHIERVIQTAKTVAKMAGMLIDGGFTSEIADLVVELLEAFTDCSPLNIACRAESLTRNGCGPKGRGFCSQTYNLMANSIRAGSRLAAGANYHCSNHNCGWEGHNKRNCPNSN